MKRRVIESLLIFTILFSTFAIAANETSNAEFTDKVDKAYQCLNDQVKAKSSPSLQDALFGALAIGSNSKLEDAINGNKKSGEACWPKSSCTIKETAQAALAYSRMGKSSKDIETWLTSKTMNVKELVWYIEVDIQNHLNSQCTMKQGSEESKITVNEDMTLQGNPGACLDVSYGGYWLKIDEKCLDKEFTISCDKDFVTTLAYQKNNGDRVFISSDTHSSASLGSTTEKVNSKCLSTGTSCDYEGTLWTALALKKLGRDVRAYLPYLLALSDNNIKYFPSTFLFILVGGDDQYSDIIQKQKLEQYWEIVSTPYNRFYDTSLALLALAGTGAAEFDSSRNYLLSVQTKEGCWNNNNIRDTAFILYAGWPKSLGVSTGTGTALCESAGYSCEANDECLNIGGSVLTGFDCPNFRDVCCTRKVTEASCEEKKGLICASNQKCTGKEVPSADGSCCIEGACENIKQENLCAISKGLCKTSCSNQEKLVAETCPDSSDVCCMQKEEAPSSNYIWIIILSVLIILLVIAIIFRRKLQFWWHSRKKGGKPQSNSRLPPGTPFGFASPRFMPRYGPPGQNPRGPALRTTRGAKSQEDKDFEETMKKLKEMSK